MSSLLCGLIQPEFLQGFRVSPITFPRAKSLEAWSLDHLKRMYIKKSIAWSDPGDGITPELQDTGLPFESKGVSFRGDWYLAKWAHLL